MALLEEDPLFRQAHTLLFYHSLPDEVNTTAFIEKWYQAKELLLPAVKGEELELHRYTGPEKCRTGAFGIIEPHDSLFTDYEWIDLAIVPAMAFDLAGNRLGRGKGYYDRLLPRLSCPKVGLCFSFQLLDQVPAEPFDVPVNRIFTENGVRIFSR